MKTRVFLRYFVRACGGMTCESTVRDITSGTSGESTVTSTAMDITGAITCESTVILYKKRKIINIDVIEMSYIGHRNIQATVKN